MPGQKYNRKISMVEAIQWTGKNHQDVKDFVGDKYRGATLTAKDPVLIVLGSIPKSGHDELQVYVGVGDYLIKNFDGHSLALVNKADFEPYFSLASEPLPVLDEVYVLFDGPPGPVSGRFIEVEDEDGHGVKSNIEWEHTTPDTDDKSKREYWRLGPFLVELQ